MTFFVDIANKIFRGPSPNKQALEVLYYLGVTRVLTLQNQQVQVPSEFERFKYPLSGLRAPSLAEVTRCLTIMRLGDIYVHCRHGVDRTGFVCAAYRVKVQGWSVEDAIQEWHELGHNKWFLFWWTAAFRRIIKKI